MGGLFNLPKYDEVKLDETRWPDFTSEELGCRNGNYPDRTRCVFCGGDYYHSPAFLDRLQSMRTRLGHPLYVNSGHRCLRWELEVGGVGGEHRRVAADVLILGYDRERMLSVARAVGFTGIGKYINFIHVDIRTRLKGEWFGKGARDYWSV